VGLVVVSAIKIKEQ